MKAALTGGFLFSRSLLIYRMLSRLLTAFSLFAMAVPSLLQAQTSWGDSWDVARASGRARLTVMLLEEDVMAYPDRNGRPAGLEVDIFQHFITWLKASYNVELTVTWVFEKKFSKFYSSVKDAQDGIVGLGTVTITEPRRKEVQFTPPFLNNVVVLVTHNSIPEVTDPAMLPAVFRSMTGIAARGTTLETYTRDFAGRFSPGRPIQLVDNQLEGVNRIAADPFYFGFMDVTNYWPFVNRDGMPLRRHSVADVPSESFAFISPLRSGWNEPLTAFFNMGAGYRANPVYKSLLVKHLGPEVTRMLQLAQQRGSAGR